MCEKGANINLQNNEGNTALICLAESCWNGKMISFFIDNKADINIKNKIGHTAFSLANMHGYYETAFSIRPDLINEQNETGNTVLMKLLYRDFVYDEGKYYNDMIFLIDNGADISIKNHEGESAEDIIINERWNVDHTCLPGKIQALKEKIMLELEINGPEL